MGFKYCVFTVMTPDLSLEEAAQNLQELGYKGVEWRVHTVPADMPNVPDYWRGNRATIDFAHILDLVPEVKALSDAYDLTISALGTYLSYKLIGEVERAMEAARMMECPQIRVGVPNYDGSHNYNDIFKEAIDGYANIESLARSYGVKANIELHRGTICPSASLGHRFVSNFKHEHIGVILDPGNMVCEGYESWKLGLELLGPYLAHVHVKNAAWEIEHEKAGTTYWKPTMVGLRNGQVDWLDVLRLLRGIGYKGWLSFEDFSPAGTRDKLVQNIQYLKKLESQI